MTAPGPIETPSSRRAAREMRASALSRAHASAEVPISRRAARESRLAETPSSHAHPPIFRAPPPPLCADEIPAVPLLMSGDRRRRRPVKHARARVALRASAALAAVAVGAVVVGSASMVTAAVTPVPVVEVAEPPVALRLGEVRIQVPPPVESPETADGSASITEPAVDSVLDPCSNPDVVAALAAGDDAATIAAAGGADVFREAVAAKVAPCVSLSDPARVWVVVDKARPFSPPDYTPAPLESPAGVADLAGGTLRADAAGAMSAMVAASRAAGAGDIAVASAFRSFQTQTNTYSGHVADRGIEGADLVSARPGHSEHQSGLAADVVPCSPECATIDDLAASPQGAWVAEHAWEYGWIVRYSDGATPVTGYLSEPWHLRYVGVDLARSYHDGGWQTLEEFFGLPAAPHYPDEH